MRYRLFSELNWTLLIRDADGVLRVEGEPAPWFGELWPSAAAAGTLEVGRDSFFLDNFLLDAGAFWDAGVAGRLESGAWTERSPEGTEFVLMATTVRVGADPVLLLEATRGPDMGVRQLRQPWREIGLLQDRLVNTETALRASRQATDAAQRSKLSFMAHMSHEIRTPLNGILGALEMVRQSALSGEQQSLLETAQSSAEDLLSVVSDLLDHSRMEAGRLELRPEDFRLRAELDLLLRPLLVRAQRRHLRLTRHVAADVPDSVHGDLGRLCQVLLNLVGNAIKFTPQGSVHVDVDAPRLPSADRGDFELRIRVTDTGVGMEAKKLEYLFRPEAWGDSGMQRRYGGTKLGLAVCQRLVASLGGAFHAVSEPGKGSEFTFTARLELAHDPANNPPPASPPLDPAIPAAESGGAPAARSTPSHTSAAPIALPPARRLRVLVVDDHPVNRQLAAAFLAKLGHFPPKFAVNGREALNCIMQEELDLVLMDLQMPELDGVATTAELRRREDAAGAPRLPVIAFTAHVRPDDHVACLAAGMDGFLTKPLRFPALAEILARFAEPPTTESAPVSPTAGSGFSESPSPSVEAVSESGLEGRDKQENEEAIDGNRGTDGAGLSPALMEMLRTATDSGMSDLELAFRQQDSTAAARAAHFIKGGLALLYDAELTATAEAVEEASAGGHWEEARSLMEKLSRRTRQLLH